MYKLSTIIASTLLIGLSSTNAADQSKIPTGILTVDRDKVRTGEKANLSWEINYPITLEDLTTPNLELKKRTKVQAFMIGTAVSNHRTKTNTAVNLGAGWANLYTGYGSGYRYVRINNQYVKDTPLNPSRVIHERIASTGTNLNFAAKKASSNNWIFKGDRRVLLMYKGDRPSSKEGWGGDASLEDYIAPYLKNGVLNIGEFDVMVAAELTHSWSQRGSSGYDSNDSIALFRFIPLED